MPISDWLRELREIVGNELLVSIGAAAIIRDDEGRILLQKRADNGRWGLPGGAIDPNEEPAEAAVREAYEETGLIVEPLKLVGLFGGKEQIAVYPNGDRTAYISATFECRITGGEITPISDETLDVRWFHPNDLPKEFVGAHSRRILAYIEGKIPYFVIPESFNKTNASNHIQSIRQKVGNRLLMAPGATAIIFNEEGEVLIQKRRDNGDWNLPGGVYEPGEEAAETFMREVYEETGLEVFPKRLIGVYGGKDYLTIYPNGDQIAYMNMVFEGEIRGGKLQKDDESLELCFVSPHALPAGFLPRHAKLLDYALAGKEGHFIFRGRD